MPHHKPFLKQDRVISEHPIPTNWSSTSNEKCYLKRIPNIEKYSVTNTNTNVLLTTHYSRYMAYENKIIGMGELLFNTNSSTWHALD